MLRTPTRRRKNNTVVLYHNMEELQVTTYCPDITSLGEPPRTRKQELVSQLAREYEELQGKLRQYCRQRGSVRHRGYSGGAERGIQRMSNNKEERQDGLVVVRQLPIIEERLHTLKALWELRAQKAESIICTEDTLQLVKAERAIMRNEFAGVEELRKRAKQAVMEPYLQFEGVYKECITDIYQRADGVYSRKIHECEEAIKKRCEDGLREYFDELCAAHHLEWLTYEQAEIKLDMASAKAETPKKLREQLATFVAQVGDSVDCIANLDNFDEIMVEFRRTLNSTDAIRTVLERHQRIEAERAAQEARRSEREREAEMVRRVEALAPPVVVNPGEKDPNEVIPRCTFTAIGATRAQLRKLKEFLNMEGIKYE